jgi:hypothetical protein
LKNGGAIDQKYIQIILEPQIGRSVEAYIDDVVVKSKKCEDLLDDLKETFDNLYKYKMMFNPKKYVFNVSSEKTTRLHGIIPRNQCEPEECESHRIIATTPDPNKNQKLTCIMKTFS